MGPTSKGILKNPISLIYKSKLLGTEEFVLESAHIPSSMKRETFPQTFILMLEAEKVSDTIADFVYLKLLPYL